MACQKRRQMKYLKHPIWAMLSYKDLVVVSGGGGGKNFGLRNYISVYKFGSILEKPMYEKDTGDDLVSSFDWGHAINQVASSIKAD